MDWFPGFGAALVMMASSAPLVLAQDTTVVRADNAPLCGSNVRLVRELRIGEVDGAEEYTFGSIPSMAVGPDGTMFVVDGQLSAVRQYDAEGRYVKTWGRRGAGPGEIGRSGRVALHGSHLVVHGGPQIPSTKPAFHSILVDYDGRIWLLSPAPSVRVTPDSGDAYWTDRLVDYDVLSRDGQFLASIRVPERFTLHHAAGDHIWGVERDELDIPDVVRYRIRRSG